MKPINTMKVSACVETCVAAAGRATAHTIQTEAEFLAAFEAVRARLAKTLLPRASMTGMEVKVTMLPTVPRSYRGNVRVSVLTFMVRASGIFLSDVFIAEVQPMSRPYGGERVFVVSLYVSHAQKEAITTRAVDKAMDGVYLDTFSKDTFSEEQ